MASLRPGVGVETETDVELLTEPSVAVTTTTVVDVIGSAVVVAEVDSPPDVVSEGGGVVAAESPEVVDGAGVSSEDVVVGEGAFSDVAGAESRDVEEDVVSGAVVLVVSADVVVAGVDPSGADVAAAPPLPVTASAALLRASPTSPCLRASSTPFRLRIAASMMKPWVMVLADRAATSSLRMCVECIFWICGLLSAIGKLGRLECDSRGWS